MQYGQEQAPTTSGAVNPDWSGFQVLYTSSLTFVNFDDWLDVYFFMLVVVNKQAFSPMPPHGFLASSPQAPYMWGVQVLQFCLL